MRKMTTRMDPAATQTPFLAVSEPGWLEVINRFWFSPADPTTLGLIRICCGVVLLYIHFIYATGLQTYFGENAWEDLATADKIRYETPILPPPAGWSERPDQPVKPPETPAEWEDREQYARDWGLDKALVYHQGQYVWSLWYHVTNPTWMAIIQAGMLVVMFLFTIGLGTRVTSVLSWMAAMCFVHRSWTLLYGVDSIMSVLLLYLMISPCGAAWSVDRWLSRWWIARRTGRRLEPAPAPVPSSWANFVLRLMQIHFCIIYLASGTSKLQGTAWWNGTALWAVVANYEFAPLHLAVYANFIHFLSQHRWLWEILLESGVVFTLLLELGFPFLVWNRRLRPYMVAGAVMLHTGIGVIMGLGTFSLFMLCLLLAFVPGEAIRRGLRLSVDWLRGKDVVTQPAAAPTGALALQRR